MVPVVGSVAVGSGLAGIVGVAEFVVVVACGVAVVVVVVVAVVEVAGLDLVSGIFGCLAELLD